MTNLQRLTEYYRQWYPIKIARDKALFSVMRYERAERDESGKLFLFDSFGQNITDKRPPTNEPPQED